MINLSSKEISSTGGAFWPFNGAFWPFSTVSKPIYSCECTHPKWFNIVELPPVNGERLKAGEAVCREFNAAAAAGTVCMFSSYETKKGKIFNVKYINCSAVTGIANTTANKI